LIFPFAVGLHTPSSDSVFLHSSSSSSSLVIRAIIPDIPPSLNPILPQIDSLSPPFFPQPDSSSPFSSSTQQHPHFDSSSPPIIEHNSFIPRR
jgi:hypothetical protein